MQISFLTRSEITDPEAKKQLKEKDKYIINVSILTPRTLFRWRKKVAIFWTFPAWNQFYPDYRGGKDAVFDLNLMQLKHLARQIKSSGIKMVAYSLVQKQMRNE